MKQENQIERVSEKKNKKLTKYKILRILLT